MATFNFDTLGNSLDNIQKMETELLSLGETFSRLNSGLNIDLTDINRFTTEFDKNKTQLLNGINPDDYNLISDKINEITSKALTEAVKKNDYNIFGTKGETINLYQQMVLEEIYNYFNNFTNVGNKASDLSSSLYNWRIGLYLLYQKLWQFPRAIASHIKNEKEGQIQSNIGESSQKSDLNFSSTTLSLNPTEEWLIKSNEDWKEYFKSKSSIKSLVEIDANQKFLSGLIFNFTNNKNIPVSSLESNMKGSNLKTDNKGNIYQIESLLMDKTISGIDRDGKLTSTDNENTIFSNIKNSIENSINVFESNLIKHSDEILNTDFAFENKYNIVVEIPKHKITGQNGVSPEYENDGHITEQILRSSIGFADGIKKSESRYKKLVDDIHFVSSSIPSFSVDVIENRINNLRRKSGGNITGDTFSVTFRDTAKRKYYLMFQQWLNMMYWKDETKDNYTSDSNNWDSMIKLHNYPDFYQGKISFILPKSNTMDMGHNVRGQAVQPGSDKPYGNTKDMGHNVKGQAGQSGSDKPYGIYFNSGINKSVTPQNSYHTGIISSDTEKKISVGDSTIPSNFYEKYYLYVVTFENVFISAISDIRLESGSSEISTFDVTFDYTFPVKFNKWDGKSLTPFMDI